MHNQRNPQIYYQQLAESILFNQIMLEHYEGLYKRFKKTWNFLSVLFAAKMIKFYQSELADAQLNQLLNEVNKNSHVSITR